MTNMQGSPRDLVDANPGDDIPRFAPFIQLGASGLKRNSGYVDEEFLPALRGRRAVKIYREMWDNSAVVGGWFAAVSQLLRQIEWRVEPGSQNSEGRRGAEFVEQCMNDMQHSWGDMITEVCSFVVYGWALSEMMFKRRKGPWYRNRSDGNLHRSKYDDNMIGWSSISGRAQETMMRWVFDDGGDVLAMVQQAPPRYQKKVLPLGKCLLFRTTIAKNNPEGRSLLRNCYEPWYYLKRHQEIEAVGVSRDLAGLPMAKVPSKILDPNGPPLDQAMLDGIKKLVTSVSRNENEGIVWPQDLDENGKTDYEFSLLNSGGSRQFDTDKIINRYKTEILQALLADFMQVGHEENGGAYNMHTDKTGMFRTALNSLAQTIADVFNRQAIPLLFEVNNWRPAELPQIVPNSVDPPDLTVLGAFLTQMAGLGMQVFPDPVLEKFVRDAAGLPQLDKRTEDVLEQQHKQSIILALAQQRMQAVQLDQQVRQGELGIQQQQLGAAQTQQQLEQGPEDPNAKGGKDPKAAANDQARGKVALQTDKVKLSQEKQKLSNLKKPSPSGPKTPVKQAAKPPGKAGGRKPVKKVHVPARAVPLSFKEPA